jgi:ActR/RegA family two-component response regulator
MQSVKHFGQIGDRETRQAAEAMLLVRDDRFWSHMVAVEMERRGWIPKITLTTDWTQAKIG